MSLTLSKITQSEACVTLMIMLLLTYTHINMECKLNQIQILSPTTICFVPLNTLICIDGVTFMELNCGHEQLAVVFFMGNNSGKCLYLHTFYISTLTFIMSMIVYSDVNALSMQSARVLFCLTCVLRTFSSGVRTCRRGEKYVFEHVHHRSAEKSPFEWAEGQHSALLAPLLRSAVEVVPEFLLC